MNIKKIAQIVGITFCSLFVLATIWTIAFPTYSATITYTTEAVPAVEAIPAQEAKDAVYETTIIEKTYENPPVEYGTSPSGRTVPYNNEADYEIYKCGVELPIGEIHYKINFEEDGVNYIEVWDENGDLVESSDSSTIAFAGSGELNDIDEDTFICQEGYSVYVWWDSTGVITFTSKELIEEAVPGVAAVPAQPAIPSEEITETLSYDSGTETWIATSNGESVEPIELEKYNELKEDIDNQMN